MGGPVSYFCLRTLSLPLCSRGIFHPQALELTYFAWDGTVDANTGVFLLPRKHHTVRLHHHHPGMLESRLLHWIFRVLVSHGGSVPRHPRCAYTVAGEPLVFLHAVSAPVQCVLRCAKTHNINTSRMFLWLPSGIMSWSSHFSGTLGLFSFPSCGLETFRTVRGPCFQHG